MNKGVACQPFSNVPHRIVLGSVLLLEHDLIISVWEINIFKEYVGCFFPFSIHVISSGWFLFICTKFIIFSLSHLPSSDSPSDFFTLLSSSWLSPCLNPSFLCLYIYLAGHFPSLSPAKSGWSCTRTARGVAEMSSSTPILKRGVPRKPPQQWVTYLFCTCVFVWHCVTNTTWTSWQSITGLTHKDRQPLTFTSTHNLVTDWPNLRVFEWWEETQAGRELSERPKSTRR